MSYPLTSDQTSGAGTFDASQHLPGFTQVVSPELPGDVMLHGFILRFEPSTPNHFTQSNATDTSITYVNRGDTTATVYLLGFDIARDGDGEVPAAVTPWDDGTLLTNEKDAEDNVTVNRAAFTAALNPLVSYTLVPGGRRKSLQSLGGSAAPNSLGGVFIGVPSGCSVDVFIQSKTPYTIL